jgi:hypothetical protein
MGIFRKRSLRKKNKDMTSYQNIDLVNDAEDAAAAESPPRMSMSMSMTLSMSGYSNFDDSHSYTESQQSPNSSPTNSQSYGSPIHSHVHSQVHSQVFSNSTNHDYNNDYNYDECGSGSGSGSDSGNGSMPHKLTLSSSSQEGEVLSSINSNTTNSNTSGSNTSESQSNVDNITTNTNNTNINIDDQSNLATLEDLPNLINELNTCHETYSIKPAQALRSLFALSEDDSFNEINRIRMAREANGTLIPTLFKFLKRCNPSSSEQYLTLLVLNNISIPKDNKKLVSIVHNGVYILSRLLCEHPNIPLICIILVNLSFCDSMLRKQLVDDLYGEIQLVEALTYALKVS